MKIPNLGQKTLGVRGFISLRLIHRLWKDCLRGWHVQPTVSDLGLLPGFGCSGPGLAYTLSWDGQLRVLDRQEWLSMEHLAVQNHWSGWRHAWLSQQSGCTDNQWVIRGEGCGSPSDMHRAAPQQRLSSSRHWSAEARSLRAFSHPVGGGVVLWETEKKLGGGDTIMKAFKRKGTA